MVFACFVQVLLNYGANTLYFFPDVHDDCLHEVAKKCKLVKYLAGEKICRKGKEALSIFFVHSGQVNGSVKGYIFDSIHPVTVYQLLRNIFSKLIFSASVMSANQPIQIIPYKILKSFQIKHKT